MKVKPDIDLPAAPRAAGRKNKYFTPYYAKSYYPPKQVLDLFPNPAVPFRTPGFTPGQKEFTSQKQMMDFLHRLNRDSDLMRMETIGHSLEGREIPLLLFTTSENEAARDFKYKPTVWLHAQLHGNEPAAGESALIMAEKLASESLGRKLLNDINVVIIPRMNPDSAFYFERLSVTQLDGNRDHMNLEMPELRAIHSAFNHFQPEIVIDAHEYEATPQYNHIGAEGALKYHDVTILPAKNLNVPEIIRKKSEEWFISSAYKDLKKAGLSHGHYYTVKAPKGKKPIITEGGVNAGTGRNTFGLKPSFSILVETLGIGIGRDTFRRRVVGQVTTHTSILRKAKEHAADIKAVVKDVRDDIRDKGRLGENNGRIVLKSRNIEMEDQSMKAIDIAEGKVIDIPIRYFSSTDSIPTMTRTRPNAYIMPPGYHRIATKLSILGIKVQKLKETQELEVECYNILDKDVDHSEEGMRIKVRTKIEKKRLLFTKGSYVMSGAQPTAHLLSLALEPESDASYIAQGYFPLGVNEEIPIYRYMNPLTFALEDE